MTSTLKTFFDTTGIDPDVVKSAETLLAERPDLTKSILASLKALSTRQYVALSECLANDQLLASIAENKYKCPVTLEQFLEENNIDVGDGTANEIDEAILLNRAHQFEIALGALPNRLGRTSEPSIFDLRFLYAARIGRD